MFNTTSMLILANKKGFQKNQAFLSLFFFSKQAKTIFKILKIELSICEALKLVEQIFKSSLIAKTSVIAFISLFKLIKVLISSFLNQNG